MKYYVSVAAVNMPSACCGAYGKVQYGNMLAICE